jgi:hypothetical protein
VESVCEKSLELLAVLDAGEEIGDLRGFIGIYAYDIYKDSPAGLYYRLTRLRPEA